MLNPPLNQPQYLPKVSGADQFNYYLDALTNCVNQCFQAHPLPPMIDNCKVRLESSYYIHKNQESLSHSKLCSDFVNCLVSRCQYVPEKRIV